MTDNGKSQTVWNGRQRGITQNANDIMSDERQLEILDNGNERQW